MYRNIFIIYCLVLTLSAVSSAHDFLPVTSYDALKKIIAEQYKGREPEQWGESVSGVKKHLDTGEKLIALTFDACGSSKGMGFDNKLITYLEQENVPATFFINARWIPPNKANFYRLATNPIFEIANHGYSHKPASINGKLAYGIQGTRSVEELVDEIELSAREILSLTGRRPRFYRSGTAYYDEVAVRVAGDLGQEVAGFSVLGDAGATYDEQQVKQALLQSAPGDIVILHMNHPESGTAAGVMQALPQLKKRGYRFVCLSDIPLK